MLAMLAVCALSLMFFRNFQFSGFWSRLEEKLADVLPANSSEIQALKLKSVALSLLANQTTCGHKNSVASAVRNLPVCFWLRATAVLSVVIMIASLKAAT